MKFEDKDKDLSVKDEVKDKDLKIGPRGQGLSSRTTTLVDSCLSLASGHNSFSDPENPPTLRWMHVSMRVKDIFAEVCDQLL